jgi:hypothetical protein
MPDGFLYGLLILNHHSLIAGALLLSDLVAHSKERHIFLVILGAHLVFRV